MTYYFNTSILFLKNYNNKFILLYKIWRIILIRQFLFYSLWENITKRSTKDFGRRKKILEKAKSLECIEDDILDLNIGGTHMIATTKLCKYPSSTLALFFSGNHPLQKYKGRYFIDSDGETFLRLIDLTVLYPILKIMKKKFIFLKN